MRCVETALAIRPAEVLGSPTYQFSGTSDTSLAESRQPLANASRELGFLIGLLPALVDK
jgi:hypothetical protein